MPAQATLLATHVKAPAELARRLAFIGIVADDAIGAELQAALRPGQQLVTRDGAVWRWDGFTMRAGAPSTAAVRLSQRNRLADIRQQIDAVAAELVEAEKSVDVQAARLATARDAKKASLEQARANEREIAEAARRKTEDAARPRVRPSARRRTPSPRPRRSRAEASDRRTDVARRTDQLRTRMAATEQALAEITGDVADAEMRRTSRQARLSAISDTQADRVAAGSSRTRIAELRAALVEAEGNCDRLARESPCALSGSARSRRIMPAGAIAWPMPMGRSASSTRGASR